MTDWCTDGEREGVKEVAERKERVGLLKKGGNDSEANPRKRGRDPKRANDEFEADFSVLSPILIPVSYVDSLVKPERSRGFRSSSRFRIFPSFMANFFRPFLFKKTSSKPFPHTI